MSALINVIFTFELEADFRNERETELSCLERWEIGRRGVRKEEGLKYYEEEMGKALMKMKRGKSVG